MAGGGFQEETPDPVLTELVGPVLDWIGKFFPELAEDVWGWLREQWPDGSASGMYALSDAHNNAIRILSYRLANDIPIAEPILSSWAGQAASRYGTSWPNLVEQVRKSIQALSSLSDLAEEAGVNFQTMMYMAALNIFFLAQALYTVVVTVAVTAGFSTLLAPGSVAAAKEGITAAGRELLEKLGDKKFVGELMDFGKYLGDEGLSTAAKESAAHAGKGVVRTLVDAAEDAGRGAGRNLLADAGERLAGGAGTDAVDAVGEAAADAGGKATGGIVGRSLKYVGVRLAARTAADHAAEGAARSGLRDLLARKIAGRSAAAVGDRAGSRVAAQVVDRNSSRVATQMIRRTAYRQSVKKLTGESLGTVAFVVAKNFVVRAVPAALQGGMGFVAFQDGTTLGIGAIEAIEGHNPHLSIKSLMQETVSSLFMGVVAGPLAPLVGHGVVGQMIAMATGTVVVNVAEGNDATSGLASSLAFGAMAGAGHGPGEAGSRMIDDRARRLFAEGAERSRQDRGAPPSESGAGVPSEPRPDLGPGARGGRAAGPADGPAVASESETPRLVDPAEEQVPVGATDPPRAGAGQSTVESEGSGAAAEPVLADARATQPDGGSVRQSAASAHPHESEPRDPQSRSVDSVAGAARPAEAHADAPDRPDAPAASAAHPAAPDSEVAHPDVAHAEHPGTSRRESGPTVDGGQSRSAGNGGAARPGGNRTVGNADEWAPVPGSRHPDPPARPDDVTGEDGIAGDPGRPDQSTIDEAFEGIVTTQLADLPADLTDPHAVPEYKAVAGPEDGPVGGVAVGGDLWADDRTLTAYAQHALKEAAGARQRITEVIQGRHLPPLPIHSAVVRPDVFKAHYAEEIEDAGPEQLLLDLVHDVPALQFAVELPAALFDDEYVERLLDRLNGLGYKLVSRRGEVLRLRDPDTGQVFELHLFGNPPEWPHETDARRAWFERNSPPHEPAPEHGSPPAEHRTAPEGAEQRPDEFPLVASDAEAYELMKASLRRTESGCRFTGDKRVIDAEMAVRGKGDGVRILAHGQRDGTIRIGDTYRGTHRLTGKRVTAEQYAHGLRKLMDEGLFVAPEDTGITLVSCYAGAGEESTAAKVAEITGRETAGPSDKLWLIPKEGREWIGRHDKGRYRVFGPDGREVFDDESAPELDAEDSDPASRTTAGIGHKPGKRKWSNGTVELNREENAYADEALRRALGDDKAFNRIFDTWWRRKQFALDGRVLPFWHVTVEPADVYKARLAKAITKAGPGQTLKEIVENTPVRRRYVFEVSSPAFRAEVRRITDALPELNLEPVRARQLGDSTMATRWRLPDGTTFDVHFVRAGEFPSRLPRLIDAEHPGPDRSSSAADDDSARRVGGWGWPSARAPLDRKQRRHAVRALKGLEDINAWFIALLREGGGEPIPYGPHWVESSEAYEWRLWTANHAAKGTPWEEVAKKVIAPLDYTVRVPGDDERVFQGNVALMKKCLKTAGGLDEKPVREAGRGSGAVVTGWTDPATLQVFRVRFIRQGDVVTDALEVVDLDRNRPGASAEVEPPPGTEAEAPAPGWRSWSGENGERLGPLANKRATETWNDTPVFKKPVEALHAAGVDLHPHWRERVKEPLDEFRARRSTADSGQSGGSGAGDERPSQRLVVALSIGEFEGGEVERLEAYFTAWGYRRVPTLEAEHDSRFASSRWFDPTTQRVFELHLVRGTRHPVHDLPRLVEVDASETRGGRDLGEGPWHEQSGQDGRSELKAEENALAGQMLDEAGVVDGWFGHALDRAGARALRGWEVTRQPAHLYKSLVDEDLTSAGRPKRGWERIVRQRRPRLRYVVTARGDDLKAEVERVALGLTVDWHLEPFPVHVAGGAWPGIESRRFRDATGHVIDVHFVLESDASVSRVPELEEGPAEDEPGDIRPPGLTDGQEAYVSGRLRAAEALHAVVTSQFQADGWSVCADWTGVVNPERAWRSRAASGIGDAGSESAWEQTDDGMRPVAWYALEVSGERFDAKARAMVKQLLGRGYDLLPARPEDGAWPDTISVRLRHRETGEVFDLHLARSGEPVHVPALMDWRGYERYAESVYQQAVEAKERILSSVRAGHDGQLSEARVVVVDKAEYVAGFLEAVTGAPERRSLHDIARRLPALSFVLETSDEHDPLGGLRIVRRYLNERYDQIPMYGRRRGRAGITSLCFLDQMTGLTFRVHVTPPGTSVREVPDLIEHDEYERYVESMMDRALATDRRVQSTARPSGWKLDPVAIHRSMQERDAYHRHLQEAAGQKPGPESWKELARRTPVRLSYLFRVSRRKFDTEADGLRRRLGEQFPMLSLDRRATVVSAHFRDGDQDFWVHIARHGDREVDLRGAEVDRAPEQPTGDEDRYAMTKLDATTRADSELRSMLGEGGGRPVPGWRRPSGWRQEYLDRVSWIRSGTPKRPLQAVVDETGTTLEHVVSLDPRNFDDNVQRMIRLVSERFPNIPVHNEDGDWNTIGACFDLGNGDVAKVHFARHGDSVREVPMLVKDRPDRKAGPGGRGRPKRPAEPAVPGGPAEPGGPPAAGSGDDGVPPAGAVPLDGPVDDPVDGPQPSGPGPAPVAAEFTSLSRLERRFGWHLLRQVSGLIHQLRVWLDRSPVSFLPDHRAALDEIERAVSDVRLREHDARKAGYLKGEAGDKAVAGIRQLSGAIRKYQSLPRRLPGLGLVDPLGSKGMARTVTVDPATGHLHVLHQMVIEAVLGDALGSDFERLVRLGWRREVPKDPVSVERRLGPGIAGEIAGFLNDSEPGHYLPAHDVYLLQTMRDGRPLPTGSVAVSVALDAVRRSLQPNWDVLVKEVDRLVDPATDRQEILAWLTYTRQYETLVLLQHLVRGMPSVPAEYGWLADTGMTKERLSAEVVARYIENRPQFGHRGAVDLLGFSPGPEDPAAVLDRVAAATDGALAGRPGGLLPGHVRGWIRAAYGVDLDPDGLRERRSELSFPDVRNYDGNAVDAEVSRDLYDRVASAVDEQGRLADRLRDSGRHERLYQFAKAYQQIMADQLGMRTHFRDPMAQLRLILTLHAGYRRNLLAWVEGRHSEVEPNWLHVFRALEHGSDEDPVLLSLHALLRFDLPRAFVHIYQRYYAHTGTGLLEFDADLLRTESTYDHAVADPGTTPMREESPWSTELKLVGARAGSLLDMRQRNIIDSAALGARLGDSAGSMYSMFQRGLGVDGPENTEYDWSRLDRDGEPGDGPDEPPGPDGEDRSRSPGAIGRALRGLDTADEHDSPGEPAPPPDAGGTSGAGPGTTVESGEAR